MGTELINNIRKAYVKAYPDKFSSIKDIPVSGMHDILKENGISREESFHIVSAERFKYTIKKSGVKLEGLVLDLCSANISIASVYDKEKVVCYEFMDEFVDELNQKNIKVVQASIIDKHLPFKNKSFDYLFCEGLPLMPYKEKGVYKSETMKGAKVYIRNVIKEIIRVTKEKAIISSHPIIYYFPRDYRKKIEKANFDECRIVLNCKKNYKTK